MNARILAAVSVVGNMALLAVAMRTGGGPGTDSAALVGTPPAAVSEVWRIKTNVTRVELTETNEAPPFHWRDVQSPDLKKFATNLLAVGCPPETVRAILESESWEKFLPRRRALLEPFHRQYWDIAASGPNIEKSSESIREALGKLKEEILGKEEGIVGSETAVKKEERRRNPQIDFLSEEKQRALEDLEKKISEETARLRPAKGGGRIPELQAKREQLQAQRKMEIRALMTPQEHSEYELRQSRYASTAQSSVGFESTPEEARVLTHIYEQSEMADTRIDPKAPDAQVRKAQTADAKKQRQETLKQTLGEERFAQFQQGLDGSFAEVYQITERYELPRETAARATETLKARADALGRLEAAREMSEPERAERTLAVNLETRATMLGVLGERALRTYENYRGPVVPDPKQASKK